ncbi:helix-turn-helix domain-containing protein [Kocuria sp. JC486]|uniref:winged helix-turn-helix transcriptional regulator n=2 Tax=Micrococcales TaxID=85006 RepID=UPI0032AED536
MPGSGRNDATHDAGRRRESEVECGVARFQALLGGPWAMLIIRELLDGPRRFTEIATALPGMSAHTLAARLRRFEEHGLLTRTAHDEIPPKVVYELTPTGHTLRPILQTLNGWATSLPHPDQPSTA